MFLVFVFEQNLSHIATVRKVYQIYLINNKLLSLPLNERDKSLNNNLLRLKTKTENYIPPGTSTSPKGQQSRL